MHCEIVHEHSIREGAAVEMVVAAGDRLPLRRVSGRENCWLAGLLHSLGQDDRSIRPDRAPRRASAVVVVDEAGRFEEVVCAPSCLVF